MSESITNPESEGEAATGSTPVAPAGPDAATAAPSLVSAQAPSEQPSAGSGNPVAVGLLVSGLLIAIIGGVLWRSMWKKASMQAFADSLYGLPASPWTGGVVAGIVVTIVGVLIAFAGLIGVAVRRPPAH